MAPTRRAWTSQASAERRPAACHLRQLGDRHRHHPRPAEPPAGTDTLRTTPEDTPLVLQTDDFGFSDPNPGDTFAAVRIDAPPDKGSLLLDGVEVAIGQVITVAHIAAGKLSYQGGARVRLAVRRV